MPKEAKEGGFNVKESGKGGELGYEVEEGELVLFLNLGPSLL